MPAHLLLDVGGVLIRTPFEMLAAAERAHGLALGALGPRGPFDPSGDPAFDDVADGALTERAYWQARVDVAAPLLGVDPAFEPDMRALFDVEEDQVVRPEVVRLMDAALADGRRVGILTNDLHDFHGREWIRRMPFLHRPHVLVDASQHGVLKPHPEASRLAIEAMAVPPDEVVYVDDQPVNVAGGREAGFEGVLLDVLDPGTAVEKARATLGLA